MNAHSFLADEILGCQEKGSVYRFKYMARWF
jgi:hypothetical protein